MPAMLGMEGNRKDRVIDPVKGTRPVSASAASQDAPAEQQIIECRKRNSKGESVITHRYRKGRLLGKGGFAHCYRVTCVDTARVYAMKIVPKSTLVKSRARQKLQTEIKIHRTLQHPRVVRFEMFFEDRENVYILLELCTNYSLSELIRKTKRFTEDEARRYMLQILEATSYLHRHQIIHRDLKLGNVFLDRDWNIKMGDFGLATKLVKDSERKRTICGTPNYIAPEILEGTAGHSYQVDLWSAGVILYTMLVGRPPYESTDVKSTYRRILANVYAFPESVPVSESAKNLVGRLLQVKPELRPSLDEILNHPFLRNGGPRQQFSTAHGLRGTSTTAASTGVGNTSSGGGSGSTGGGGNTCSGNAVHAYSAARAAGQKHTGTPERCAAGGFVRPPLKTRNANVEGEGDVAPLESAAPRGAAVGKARAAAGATGVNNRNNWQAPASSRSRAKLSSGAAAGNGSSAAATAAGGGGGATSARVVVPRTGGAKGFSVFCDAKEQAGFRSGGGGGGGVRGGVGGVAEAGLTGSKRVSPLPSARRREAAVVGGGSGSGGGGGVEGGGGGRGGVKSPADGNKENDPRRGLGTSGVRVAVKGPVTRRPLMRSASTTVPAPAETWSGKVGVSAGSIGGGAGAGKEVGGRKVGLRRSASAVGAHADGGRVSSRGAVESASTDASGKGAIAGRGRGMGATVPASPRVRAPVRGARSAMTSSFSPYRSPPLGASGLSGGGSGSGGRSGRGSGSGGRSGGSSGAATRVNARAGAGGDGTGTTPRRPARARTQQRLDFGSTPAGAARQGGGGGALGSGSPGEGKAGGGGTLARAAARSASCSGSRGTPSPPANPPRGFAGRGLGERGRAASEKARQAPAVPSAAAVLPGGSLDPDRDTLENMHDLLTWNFALGDRGEGVAAGDAAGAATSGRSGVARGTRSSSAAAAAAAAAAARGALGGAEVTPPTVWVTRYVDYSKKYGLGFLLSDGGAGVYFNDATKIVVEPEGGSFDYIERARRPSPGGSGDSAGGGVGTRGGGGGGGGDQPPPRVRHTLDKFPDELLKKVTLLDHFRGYLQDLEEKEEGASSAALARAGAGEGRRGGSREPLTFLKKWLRTRNAILFRLSNGTVQVMFSDKTEILLSKEARVVTFVSKTGKRETKSLQRVLQEQRLDITKRVRYSTELIAQVLRRS